LTTNIPAWVVAFLVDGKGYYCGGRFGRHFGGKYYRPKAGEIYERVGYNPELRVGVEKTEASRFPMGMDTVHGETVKETVLESWRGFFRSRCEIIAPPDANAYGQDRTGPVLQGWDIPNETDWMERAVAARKIQDRLAKKPGRCEANRRSLELQLASMVGAIGV
jgi:hypothetical protein